MARGDLSDQQYELIKELLPSERSGRVGRPWRDHRTMINGIRWVLRTGAPWRDLPARYAPWQSVYDRFVRWRKDEAWSTRLAMLERDLRALARDIPVVRQDLACSQLQALSCLERPRRVKSAPPEDPALPHRFPCGSVERDDQEQRHIRCADPLVPAAPR